MTNKYLEKIAQEDKPVGTGKRTLGMFAGSMASVPILQLANQLGHKTLEIAKNGKEHADLGTIKKMMRDNKLNVSFNTRAHNVNKNISRHGFAGQFHSMVSHDFGSPMYAPSSHFKGSKKDFIMGVKGRTIMDSLTGAKPKMVNKDIVMHELGHAKDYAKFGKAKAISTMIAHKSKIAAPLMLLHKDTENYAVPVAAALELPTLRAETMANYHAYKGIKAHKGAHAARSFAKHLLPTQMGNYGAAAAASVAGVYAGKKIIDHLKKTRSTND